MHFVFVLLKLKSLSVQVGMKNKEGIERVNYLLLLHPSANKKGEGKEHNAL